MAASEIPVVDFSAYSICKNEECDEVNPEINKLAQEIYDAFTTVGFVYIKNHGIPESEVCTGIYGPMGKLQHLLHRSGERKSSINLITCHD